MASSSCDDDFPLLSADDQPFTPHHRFNHPTHAASSAAADVPDKYAAADADPASAAAAADAAKRKDRPCDDLDSPISFKKTRFAAGGGGDYRKDREEWSDAAIECLLNAYTEKYEQLNRGNLRGRDWEEVAAVVSERSAAAGGEGKGSKGSGGGGVGKSVEQCKNKVDNLKKRYKAERQRLSNGSLAVSHWPWFKKMEQIVGNSISSKAVSDDDKSAVVVGGGTPSMPRQAKRCLCYC